VLSDLGAAYSMLKEPAKALARYNRAVELDPSYPHTYNNKGITLQRLNRLNEAIDSFNQAININQFFAEAYNNRGNALAKLNRLNDAIEDYGEAINIKNNYIDAYNNRAITFLESKKFNEALEDFEKVIHLDSDFYHALGHLIHVKMNLCDWRNLENLKNEFVEKTRLNKPISPPFVSLSLIDSPQIQFDSSRIYAQNLSIYSKTKKIKKTKSKKEKIRIGYFSADFHDHATMHLIAEVLEQHDKKIFDIFGFSYGRHIKDQWNTRAIKSFKEFIDVRNKSDKEISQLSKEMEIDIAIDLKGFTTDERAGIFMHKLAPIQINYLGYPGSMASPFMDYIIADATLIPKKLQQYYSEKIIYLPNSYQANMAERVISKKEFQRKEMGLPDDAFVFASFNNSWKITPETFDGWMRILLSTKGSVLWLLSTNSIQIKNLRNEAELRGINANRLIFASFLPIEEHLKRIQLADLFLDTFPYNAHTTASDSLRMGLPLITRTGNSFASRVAASLLSSINLPDLITTTKEDFETLAIDFAINPQKLLHVRNRLLNNIKISPLFNSKLFTYHLESAYKIIYKRYSNNLPPDHIYIE
jgi:predicted O-linked N-acetylglucosamine transferase (SPINDLY family)